MKSNNSSDAVIMFVMNMMKTFKSHQKLYLSLMFTDTFCPKVQEFSGSRLNGPREKDKHTKTMLFCNKIWKSWAEIHSNSPTEPSKNLKKCSSFRTACSKTMETKYLFELDSHKLFLSNYM